MEYRPREAFFWRHLATLSNCSIEIAFSANLISAIIAPILFTIQMLYKNKNFDQLFLAGSWGKS